MSITRDRWMIYGVSCILLFGAILLIAFGTDTLKYDEAPYMGTAQLLLDYGLTNEFFDRYTCCGAGPLYAIVHAALSPITGMEPPWVRYVNLLGLTSVLAMVVTILRRMGSNNPILLSLGLLAVPSLWPVSGQALTEIPAMIPFTAGLLLLVISTQKDVVRSAGKHTQLIVLMGLLFGIASIGRQPYLGAALILPFVMVALRLWRSLDVMVFLFCLLPLPITLFIIWGGIVPSGVAHSFTGVIVDYSKTSSGGGLMPAHGIISLGYTTAFILFVAPKWLMWSRNFFLYCLPVIGLNVAYPIVEIFPMRSLARSWLSPEAYIIYGYICSAVIIMFALWFVVSSSLRLWEGRRNGILIFAILATGALGIHQAGITNGFSSRYTVMSLPLIAIMVSSHYRPSLWQPARMSAGGFLGILSLARYMRIF